MKELKHLELFAGVGGFRRAIDLFCTDNKIMSTCVGFSHIDKYALQSYKSIHSAHSELALGDIKQFTSDKNNIKKLPDFDLISGGFPCQAFSMMGKKKGFEDDRGNIFYSIIEILKIKKPNFLLLENVRNLKNHDDGKTYKEIKRSLTEDAGYDVKSIILDTKNYGLPQTRRRIFLFGVKKEYFSKKTSNIEITEKDIIESASKLNGSSSLNNYNNVLDLLKKQVEEKYYLSERIKPTILANGSKNFKSKSEINQLIARPLTATMGKMHRACQDNYYSDAFLEAKNPRKYLEQSFPKEIEAKHRIRKITPAEAFMLQGFNEKDVLKAYKDGISNAQLYKQAGNAVSVNTVYSLLNYLIKTEWN